MNAVTPFEQASTPRRAAGQATMVEQSRAVAEVQAAVVIAQQRPRDIQAAMEQMRMSSAMPYLAERAFFRFPRGGQSVSGKSVHLARELARCWGNVVYGVKELRRDDAARESEMMAYAWDIQTNARNETVFIVPHMRDKRGGAEALTDMRDIYENNANNGARRLRECIFAVLPPWYVEEAAELCSRTLKDGGGKPLPNRIADCIAAFRAIGITKEQMERKTGRASGMWTPEDVAQLGVVFKSIQRGEISKDEEFPREEAHKQIDADADGFERAAAGAKGGKGGGKQMAQTDHDPKTGEAFDQQPQQDGAAEEKPAAEAADWPAKVAELKAKLDACADPAALVALKKAESATIKMMPDDVFADWNDAVEARAAALKGGA
jgi:hypothetical protein